ncbi:TetR family transcriptional regulator [Lederbergia wuyishanensis]|uniref:AcrR family transcriptional regulator n=1 Tax=Lederbergia wuyishanensis TaxID=1347903 RepID=A0ABU0D767_9BACI|nr:TetR/AcrR family transcriptional regulator [Lederbergia wuyishanensis]MCJ8008880.1 TetR family transcriptional regulator [Lederbergia wuyishanensis]MDQ0344203.1 AcrR family transcriptional regulator [Lederbergia wuyishanensis]
MKPHDRIMAAVKEIADKSPADKITFADIAKSAGVHWTTVRRHFGSKETMREKIINFQVSSQKTFLDTKTKILDSANKVFGKYGYEGATLDLIAEDAGMTKGAVYWHFSSKGDLFIELINKSLRDLISELPSQLEAVFQFPEPETALNSLLKSQFQVCEEENDDQPTLFFEFISQRRDTEVKEKLNEAFANLFAETAKILRKLQKRGLISENVDSEALSVTLHGLINGMVLMWTVSPRAAPLTQLVDSISKVIWEGIKPN